MCADFLSVADVLLASPQTLVHGDCYAQNILFRDGEIFLLDWEAAAIGAGEIDLTAFSEDWPEADERRFQRAYQIARWPAGAPELFERRLAAAHIFTHLQAMGGDPGWVQQPEEAQWRLGELRRWAGRFASA